MMHSGNAGAARATILFIGASFLAAAIFTSAIAVAPASAQQERAGEDAAAATGNHGPGTGGGHGTGGGGRGFGGGTPSAANGTPAIGTKLKLETISGEITRMDGAEPAPSEGKSEGRAAAARRPGPMLTLRTQTETIQVHAGSPTFREEHGFALKVGDVIEVTGVRSGQDTQPVFVAHVIKKQTETLRLRDEQGNKLWKPRKRADLPTLTDITAQVVDINAPAAHTPGSGLGRATRFIIVHSGTEDLAVEAGPEDYIESKGLKLKAGDAVTINGWRLPSARTGNRAIVLAASISNGKTTVKVRDANRHPLWQAEKKTETK